MRICTIEATPKSLVSTLTALLLCCFVSTACVETEVFEDVVAFKDVVAEQWAAESLYVDDAAEAQEAMAGLGRYCKSGKQAAELRCAWLEDMRRRPNYSAQDLEDLRKKVDDHRLIWTKEPITKLAALARKLRAECETAKEGSCPAACQTEVALLDEWRFSFRPSWRARIWALCERPCVTACRAGAKNGSLGEAAHLRVVDKGCALHDPLSCFFKGHAQIYLGNPESGFDVIEKSCVEFGKDDTEGICTYYFRNALDRGFFPRWLKFAEGVCRKDSQTCLRFLEQERGRTAAKFQAYQRMCDAKLSPDFCAKSQTLAATLGSFGKGADPVRFASASKSLTADAKAILGKIASRLKSHDGENVTFVFHVRNHNEHYEYLKTDLDKARSEAIEAYLSSRDVNDLRVDTDSNPMTGAMPVRGVDEVDYYFSE